MKNDQSKQLFDRAIRVIPGGVNSPVRAFKSVGGNPLFIKSAKGAYMYDEDGNAFVDMINSWGPMILGHAFEEIEDALRQALSSSFSFGAPTRKEVEMAELITSMVPNIEMVRMVNSGTEATMAAIRLARGYTKKEKIIKFEGCYHGHGDSFLIAAGSGVATLGTPDSPGVTQGVANDTLTAPYNDLAAIEQLIQANPNSIAAMIIEPVVGNMGCVLPKPGYLEGLRTLCDKHHILLIFDEVMTGFRLAKGGAQERLGIKADIVTYGKIIGGGLPVGAYGASKEIMEHIAPAGPIYQAGTLSGNPLAMTAGMAMLNYLNTHPEVYTQLEKTGNALVNGFKKDLNELGADLTINHIGSMYSLFFTDNEVVDFATAKTSNTVQFGTYFRAMLEQGIYLAPSQFESLFLSTALDDEILHNILIANKKALEIALNQHS